MILMKTSKQTDKLKCRVCVCGIAFNRLTSIIVVMPKLGTNHTCDSYTLEILALSGVLKKLVSVNRGWSSFYKETMR